MSVKISDLTAKGSAIAATDLVEIAQVSGGGYVSKSVTGQDIIDAASAGSQDLQQVTDIGSETTNTIVSTAGLVATDSIATPDQFTYLTPSYLEVSHNSLGEQLTLSSYLISIAKGCTLYWCNCKC